MRGVTLDAGALIAAERADRRVTSMLARTAEQGMRVAIPATVLAQVIRNPARQVTLRNLIHRFPTDVVPLNEVDAVAVGVLLARSGTADVVDAHVVICARQNDHAIITSDPKDLRRLDSNLELLVV